MLTKAATTPKSVYSATDYPNAPGTEHITKKRRMDLESDKYLAEFLAAGGVIEQCAYRGPRDMFPNR
jgi:hypothetical protein